MRKLFLILFALSSLIKLKAQIILDKNELKNININNFIDSKYYKAIKSKPIITSIISSGRLLDGGCVDISNTSYYFKKEKILFKFTNSDGDTSVTKVLSDIYLNDKNNIFITEDSIRVGDKVSLSILCKDIEKLKNDGAINKYNSLEQIFHNGTFYEFKKIQLKKISNKTIITINKIIVRPQYLVYDKN